ncbi:MAG: hypothetical protein K0R51_737 [Cytophagaceae bacterium]|jgi:hypothetical protein|nr:hypothetical protein [Cytophagaceae bacterium]
MKKLVFTFLASCLTLIALGQTPEQKKLIELSKSYQNFMFRNEPNKQDIADITSSVPENLKATTDFVVQTISNNNKLLSTAFLSRPEETTLKQIYILYALGANARNEYPIDNIKLIDSLSNKDLSSYELLDNYYGMLFAAISNKNQPFNLSKVNLTLNEYKLKDETEKGILVLQAMSFCGTTIWGYMNIVKPANTKKAYDGIKKFPKINGHPYYQYTDFYFKDFDIIIEEGKGAESYKAYYINKFYELLMSHLICLHNEGGSEKEKNDLLLGSILKERKLYKYTKYKKTLEEAFQTQEKE